MVISRVICPHTDGMSHSLFEITKPAQSLLFGFRIIQLQTTEHFLAGRDDFNIKILKAALPKSIFWVRTWALPKCILL